MQPEWHVNVCSRHSPKRRFLKRPIFRVVCLYLPVASVLGVRRVESRMYVDDIGGQGIESASE